jgi:hypothetical protein
VVSIPRRGTKIRRMSGVQRPWESRGQGSGIRRQIFGGVVSFGFLHQNVIAEYSISEPQFHTDPIDEIACPEVAVGRFADVDFGDAFDAWL